MPAIATVAVTGVSELTVTFDGAVTGLLGNGSDFSNLTGNFSGCSVGNVTGSGAQYALVLNCTVITNATGTITIAGAAIVDSASNAYAGDINVTIVDRLAVDGFHIYFFAVANF